MFYSEIIEAARNIGKYYLSKNNLDYKLTEQEILETQITDIEIIKTNIFNKHGAKNEKTIVIYTKRPEKLIGKKGENIDSLQKFLKCKISVKEISDINYHIIPINPKEYPEDIYNSNYDYKETCEL